MADLRPGITVIIPTIPPRKKLLERALESVRAQTLQPYDVLVSTDNRKEGAAVRRNEALKCVRTEWVAFLDDDDEFLPNHLELLAARAELENADLVYPWFTVVGGTDPLRFNVGGKLVTPLGIPFGAAQAQYILTDGNFIPVTHLSRTEVVLSVGGFPVPETTEWPFRDCEDWGFLKRMLQSGAVFSHEPTRTWVWHRDIGSTSGRADRW